MNAKSWLVFAALAFCIAAGLQPWPGGNVLADEDEEGPKIVSGAKVISENGTTYIVVNAAVLAANGIVTERLKKSSCRQLRPRLSSTLDRVDLEPEGEPVFGVIVPAQAVVWMNGKPWIYVEDPPGRFSRHGISTAHPVEGGWLIEQQLTDKTVVTGSQEFLSQEFSSQIRGGD